MGTLVDISLVWMTLNWRVRFRHTGWFFAASSISFHSFDRREINATFPVRNQSKFTTQTRTNPFNDRGNMPQHSVQIPSSSRAVSVPFQSSSTTSFWQYFFSAQLAVKSFVPFWKQFQGSWRKRAGTPVGRWRWPPVDPSTRPRGVPQWTRSQMHKIPVYCVDYKLITRWNLFTSSSKCINNVIFSSSSSSSSFSAAKLHWNCSETAWRELHGNCTVSQVPLELLSSNWFSSFLLNWILKLTRNFGGIPLKLHWTGTAPPRSYFRAATLNYGFVWALWNCSGTALNPWLQLLLNRNRPETTPEHQLQILALYQRSQTALNHFATRCGTPLWNHSGAVQVAGNDRGTETALGQRLWKRPEQPRRGCRAHRKTRGLTRFHHVRLFNCESVSTGQTDCTPHGTSFSGRIHSE